jgi:hypothetical protein
LDLRSRPPNFDRLSDREKIIIDEVLYRRALCHNHGWTLDQYAKISKIRNLGSKLAELESKKDQSGL